jgi:heterodisulfide reductase subunit B
MSAVGARTYAYFPGCTLATTAVEYDLSGRAVAQALGLELRELPEWNCCGATFPLSTENVMDMIGPARSLIAAEASQEDLVTLCAVCFNVLRRTDRFLKTHPVETERLNLFLEAGHYLGSGRVRHLLEILRDDQGWQAVAAQVTRPLTGWRMAAYYGCMLLRPAAEMQLDDPEAPTILGDLIRALGAEPVSMSHATECCGSYLLVSQPGVTDRLSQDIVQSARRAGAQAVVSACPLCRHNLEQAQRGEPEAERLPIVYFTQVLAAALGLSEHTPHLLAAETAA